MASHKFSIYACMDSSASNNTLRSITHSVVTQ